MAAQTNPLKKCLSMYKIKEKMDQLENNALQEEKQLQKQREEEQAAAEQETLKKGKKAKAGTVRVT